MKLGSGGANFAAWVWIEEENEWRWYSDVDFILHRLPLAQGRQFETVFWAMQRHPETGQGIRCVKVFSLEETGLKRKIA